MGMLINMKRCSDPLTFIQYSVVALNDYIDVFELKCQTIVNKTCHLSYWHLPSSKLITLPAIQQCIFENLRMYLITTFDVCLRNETNFMFIKIYKCSREMVYGVSEKENGTSMWNLRWLHLWKCLLQAATLTLTLHYYGYICLILRLFYNLDKLTSGIKWFSNLLVQTASGGLRRILPKGTLK